MVQYCVDCAPDSKFCQKCDDDHTIDPSKTICYIRPELKVRSTQFLSASSKAIILFQDKIVNKNFIDLLDISIVDDKGNPYTEFSSLKIDFLESNDGISITIDFQKTIFSGKIIVTNKPTTVEAFDTGSIVFPKKNKIEVNDVSKSKGALTTTLTDSAATTTAVVKSFSSSSKVILVTVSPSASVILDKIAAYFNYLQFLDGPLLVFPDIVLSMLSSGSFLPGNIPPNYFEHMTDDLKCQPK